MAQEQADARRELHGAGALEALGDDREAPRAEPEDQLALERRQLHEPAGDQLRERRVVRAALAVDLHEQHGGRVVVRRGGLEGGRQLVAEARAVVAARLLVEALVHGERAAAPDGVEADREHVGEDGEVAHVLLAADRAADRHVDRDDADAATAAVVDRRRGRLAGARGEDRGGRRGLDHEAVEVERHLRDAALGRAAVLLALHGHEPRCGVVDDADRRRGAGHRGRDGVREEVEGDVGAVRREREARHRRERGPPAGERGLPGLELRARANAPAASTTASSISCRSTCASCWPSARARIASAPARPPSSPRSGTWWPPCTSTRPCRASRARRARTGTRPRSRRRDRPCPRAAATARPARRARGRPRRAPGRSPRSRRRARSRPPPRRAPHRSAPPGRRGRHPSGAAGPGDPRIPVIGSGSRRG